MLQDMTHKEALEKIDSKIEQIKKQLMDLGPLRPGTLSEQYSSCGKAGCRCQRMINPKKHGPYCQISYFHKGKSKTEFVRSEKLQAAMEQTQRYKTLQTLVDRWVQLGLSRYRLTYKIIAKEYIQKP